MQFSTITSIQTVSGSLGWKAVQLFSVQEGSMSEILASLKQLYATLEVKPDSTANACPYPADHSSNAGMGIEMKYAQSFLFGGRGKSLTTLQLEM
jgi:hypothetical protein